jgi:hypothetical protein
LATISSVPQEDQSTSSKPDQYQCDVLKVADAKIAERDALLREMDGERKTVDARISALQAQIQRRDDEIDRLGKLLEVSHCRMREGILWAQTANPTNTLFPEPAERTSEQRHVAQLETQVLVCGAFGSLLIRTGGLPAKRQQSPAGRACGDHSTLGGAWSQGL